MAARDELQTLRRGLQALAILKTDGPVTVAGLARQLDIARANAHRIVSTLMREGYCRKIPNSHLYVASLESQTALAGRSLTGALIASSIDIIEALGERIKWPVALSTPDGATMVTRIATHLSTPLALDRIAPGNVAPVFDASTGIVFLALTDPQTRAETLAAAESAYPAAAAEWRPHLEHALEGVREQGYFVLTRPSAEASLAVPIRLDGRPIGGIAMRYIKSAASRTSIVETCLPHLQEAAAAIEAAVAKAMR